MNIGELFLNLGIKGADKTVGAIVTAKKGMGELKSVSLETKAAIAAAIYGLEKLMSTSAEMGTNLMNFSSFTGKSAQMLQQWQYAGRQAGVTAQETAGSFKTLQSTMTKMLMNQGAPTGWSMFASKMKPDLKRVLDLPYMMEQLQKFSQTVPPEVRNEIMKSFGLGENMISGMSRNAFNPEMFAKAPVTSDAENSRLNKVDAALGNIAQKVEMSMAHFTAAHGEQLVADIEKITMAFVHLAEALVVLGDKFKIFKMLGAVVGEAALVVDTVTGTGQGKDVQKWAKGLVSGDSAPKNAVKNPRSVWDSDYAARHVAPKLGPLTESQSKDIEVNQTLVFQHDGHDPKKVSDSHRQAAKQAYRQSQAQAQEN